jgi:hypothetical protein
LTPLVSGEKIDFTEDRAQSSSLIERPSKSDQLGSRRRSSSQKQNIVRPWKLCRGVESHAFYWRIVVCENAPQRASRGEERQEVKIGTRYAVLKSHHSFGFVSKRI